jgi:hypothetical protein
MNETWLSHYDPETRNNQWSGAIAAHPNQKYLLGFDQYLVNSFSAYQQPSHLKGTGHRELTNQL